MKYQLVIVFMALFSNASFGNACFPLVKKFAQDDKAHALKAEISELLKSAKKKEKWDYQAFEYYSNAILNKMKNYWDEIGVSYKVSESGKSLIVSNTRTHPLNNQCFYKGYNGAQNLIFEFHPGVMLSDSSRVVNDRLGFTSAWFTIILSKHERLSLSPYNKIRYSLSYEEAIEGKLREIASKKGNDEASIESLKHEAFIESKNIKNSNLGPKEKQFYDFLMKQDDFAPRYLWEAERKEKFLGEFLEKASDFLDEKRVPFSVEGKKIVLFEGFRKNHKVENYQVVFDPSSYLLSDRYQFSEYVVKSYREGFHNVSIEDFFKLSFHSNYEPAELYELAFNYDNDPLNKKIFEFWTNEKLPRRYRLSPSELPVHLEIIESRIGSKFLVEMQSDVYRGHRLEGEYQKLFNSKNILDIGTWLIYSPIIHDRTYLVAPIARPIQFVERESGSNLYLFDLSLAKEEIFESISRYLNDYIRKVQEQFLSVPGFSPEKNFVDDFFQDAKNLSRCVFITETKDSIFTRGKLIRMPRAIQNISGTIGVKANYSNNSLPIDTIFKDKITLKNRSKSLQLTKLFDFGTKEESMDSMHVLEKHIRILSRKFKEDQSVSHFYWHSYESKRVKFYSFMGADIEKMSLPLKSDGSFDYDYIEGRKDLLRISAFKKFWEKVKSSDDPVKDGLIVKPSIYNEGKSIDEFEPDFIFYVHKNNWLMRSNLTY